MVHIMTPEQRELAVAERDAANYREQLEHAKNRIVELEQELARQPTHDDETMQKVYRALRENGVIDVQIVNVITAMQNDGILFREIPKD